MNTGMLRSLGYWVGAGVLAGAAGYLFTFATYLVLGTFAFPFLRPPLDDNYAEGPTEWLMFWVSLSLGVLFAMGIIAAARRYRERRGTQSSRAAISS
jgi:hypothetical protein